MPLDKKSKILQALGKVYDPDLKKDLVSLNMIRDLVVEDEKVSFILFLTTLACPLQALIKKECVEAIRACLGPQCAVDIKIEAEVLSQGKKSLELEGVKNIIPIASGKGGVGKSTVAVNIAVSLASQGAKVGLLDADIFGPSVPLMLGCMGQRPFIEAKGEKKYMLPLEAHGIKFNSIGLLTDSENKAAVWRGPMASKAFRQLLANTLWGELDYLFIDMPPGTSDINITLLQAVSIAGVVIVTTPQRVATLDAERAIDAFTNHIVRTPLLGVVENMSWYERDSNKEKPFGSGGGKFLAKKYNAPLLGSIAIDSAISIGGDSGIPIAVDRGVGGAKDFLGISQALAQQVSICNSNTL